MQSICVELNYTLKYRRRSSWSVDIFRILNHVSFKRCFFFYICCNNNLSKSVLDFPLTCSLILLFRFVIENLRALKALKEKAINCLNVD